MTGSTTVTATAPSPARAADQHSRITRLATRILMRTVFRSEALAYEVATQLADGIIAEHGGASLYIPVADRRAGLTNHAAISADLQALLTPEQIRTPGAASSALLCEVASRHGVSERTAYRVLASLRAELAEA